MEMRSSEKRAQTAGSESFWADQCVDEIDKHAERHERGQRIIENHGSLLKPVACDGVNDRENKKSRTRSDENGIKHGKLRSLKVGRCRIQRDASAKRNATRQERQSRPLTRIIMNLDKTTAVIIVNSYLTGRPCGVFTTQLPG